jgi:hypothetical protein
MAFKEKKAVYTNADKKIHTEMNRFSGATWEELEDIWPKSLRISSDVHMILSVFYPAFRQMNIRMKQEEGITIRIDDFLLLFWYQRCEEAKGNVATVPYVPGKPLQWNARMLSIKQSRLFRMKLIENMPLMGLRMYRVTAKGKQLMRKFVTFLEQAHKDVRFFAADCPNVAKYNVALQRYLDLGGAFDYETMRRKLNHDDNGNFKPNSGNTVLCKPASDGVQGAAVGQRSRDTVAEGEILCVGCKQPKDEDEGRHGFCPDCLGDDW